MKGKKKKIQVCLLFTLIFFLFSFFIKGNSYRAAESMYENAKEFYFNTGTSDDKHIKIRGGTIYFGTRAKLAHTYASEGHKYYNTLGYDVTLTGGGKSLTFSVKRGGSSLSEVAGSMRVDSDGYQYLLYSIPTETVINLAQLANPTNAATVLATSEIKVRMDAIVTVRQNGVQGSIVEDGRGGITEYETNGPIYHLKNQSELDEMKGIFSGHQFLSYYNIVDYLTNYKLTLYYNVGPATVGNTSYSKGTYGGTSNMLFQNGNIYNKNKYTLMQPFKLMDPVKDLNLNYTGYHLNSNEEWKKSDGTIMSASQNYIPERIEPSVINGDKTMVLYANWKPNTYYVEYDGNGGTGSMADTTATYDKEFVLTKNTFTKTGYTFKGWATSADSKTVVYTDQKTVSNLTATNKGTVKLYAVWQENIYRIILDSTTPMNQDATIAGTKTLFEKYSNGLYKEKECVSKISTIIKPAEPGYIFEGYYVGKSGAGTQYIDETGKIKAKENTFTTDVTLFAKWKPIAYTIKYHGNNGNGTMADMPAIYDRAELLRPNTFTRMGHKFIGWSTSKNGDVLYKDMEEVINLTAVNDGEVVLYAIWEPDIYTIELDNDNADFSGTKVYYEKFGVGNYTAKECDAEMRAITKPRKRGYTFGGYYTRREGQGTQCIDAAGKVTATNTTFDIHTTLYAWWKPNTYRIVYSANGGSGRMDDSTASYGETVTLRTCTFTNTGKTFVGWSTSGTGNAVYSNRENVLNLTATDGEEITLYAVWSENIYRITLNSDGAENKGSETYYEKYAVGNYKDSSCTATINSITKPQKKGYIFGGYYTGKDGTGIQYIDETGKITASQTTFTANKTLYAKWVITSYIIRYDANGGAGSMQDTLAKYNQTVSLESNGFVKLGNHFEGWSLTREGEDLYKDKETVRNLNTVDGEIVTLYAIWKNDVYRISLNCDGAEERGTDRYFEKYSNGNYTTFDCTKSITTITKPAWDGKTFGGYYTGRDGTGDQHIDETGKIISTNTSFISDITLYAYWIPNTYTIKYDANGGEGTMADTIATYGESVTLRTCTLTKQGHVFRGWRMASNDVILYKDRDSVENLAYSGAIVLYAVWEPIKVQLSLNHLGGYSDTDEFFELYGTGFYLDSFFSKYITQISKPVMSGFFFRGYFLNSMGNGICTVNESGVIAAENTAFLKDSTIFAKWTAKTFTISLDRQGGRNGSEGVIATYQKILPVAEAPQRPGYRFQGYYTATSGNGTKYYDAFMNTDIVYMQEKDMTLYAYWLDDIAPEVSLNVDIDQWTNQKVTLTAYAKDEGLGISSVKIFELAADDTWTEVAGETELNGTKTKELTIENKTEGVVRYKAVATDRNGNMAECYNTVYYDATAPQGEVNFEINGMKISIELDVTDINTGDLLINFP